MSTAVETAADLEFVSQGQQDGPKYMPYATDDSASEKFKLIDDECEYQENLLQNHDSHEKETEQEINLEQINLKEKEDEVAGVEFDDEMDGLDI